MPKYFFEEETLSDWASYAAEQDPSSTVEEQISQYTREPDGQLSTYEPAQCALAPDKLKATARLALEEITNLGVTQMVVRYDGGGDEGFVHWHTAKTGAGELKREELLARFEKGPLGDVPETSFFYHAPNAKVKITRQQWAEEALELFLYEVAAQLLGEGFGTGEYSLEGAFVVDLEANTLTDIAPEEN